MDAIALALGYFVLSVLAVGFVAMALACMVAYLGGLWEWCRPLKPDHPGPVQDLRHHFADPPHATPPVSDAPAAKVVPFIRRVQGNRRA